VPKCLRARAKNLTVNYNSGWGTQWLIFQVQHGGKNGLKAATGVCNALVFAQTSTRLTAAAVPLLKTVFPTAKPKCKGPLTLRPPRG